jgi:hypothetical protein
MGWPLKGEREQAHIPHGNISSRSGDACCLWNYTLTVDRGQFLTTRSKSLLENLVIILLIEKSPNLFGPGVSLDYKHNLWHIFVKTESRWYLPIGALEMLFIDVTLRHLVTGAIQRHSITAKESGKLNE